MRNFMVAVSLMLFAGGTCVAAEQFTGQWRVIAGCPDGYGVAVKLVQIDTMVIGEWSDMPFREGSAQGVNTYGGRFGELKGEVKGKTVAVQTCVVDEASECKFIEAGILELAGVDLVWTNQAFANPASIPPRGSRLVLGPGSADVETWKCRQ